MGFGFGMPNGTLFCKVLMLLLIENTCQGLNQEGAWCRNWPTGRQGVLQITIKEACTRPSGAHTMDSHKRGRCKVLSSNVWIACPWHFSLSECYHLAEGVANPP